MRLFLLSILLFTGILIFAQPPGYTEGTLQCYSINGIDVGYFRSVGWTQSNGHTLVFFGGQGQTNCTNFNQMQPGLFVTATGSGGSGWDGVTVMPDASERKWEIILITTKGCAGSQYEGAVAGVLGSGQVVRDTSQRGRYHLGGGSLGPGNANCWINNGGAWSKIFSTSIMMSTTWITAGSEFSIPINYAWYGTADANSGTPPAATVAWYNSLPGTAGGSKRMRYTTGGTHSNNTWGDCFRIDGTDSSTSRWIWMIQEGENLQPDAEPPTVNAGADQTIKLPTNQVTLIGTATANAPEASITSYQWTKISGGAATINTPTTGTTTVSGLEAGTYVFRLTCFDSNGQQGSDEVTVTVQPSTASTYQIPIKYIGSDRMVWDLTPLEGKNPDSLFNGKTSDGNKIDQNGSVNNSFVSPYQFLVVLKDSAYSNIAIQYYHGVGNSNWIVRAMDSNLVVRGEYPFTQAYETWRWVQGNPDTISVPIKYLFFQASNAGSDLRQFRIFGTPVAKVSSVFPTETHVSRPDPGIKFQGGSSIDDKDVNYMMTSNGDPIYGSFRQPENVFVSAYDQSAAWGSQPFSFTKYGDLNTRKLQWMKNKGVDVMVYYNGSSILTAPWLDSTANYGALSGATNIRKDIPVGSDSTLASNWAFNTGRLWKAITHLWGNNPSSIIYGYDLRKTLLTAGQAKLVKAEIGNEDNKTWNGTIAYHSPEVAYAKQKAAWDSIKSVDPTVKVYMGATYYMDTNYRRAMYMWHHLKNPGTPFPADGFTFNQYISDAYGGQPKGFNTNKGISPEQYQVTEMTESVKGFRDFLFPNTDIEWTEINYATHSESNYDVHGVGSLGDSIVQANFMIRTLERTAVIADGINTVYNYFHTSDGSGDFRTMFMVREIYEEGTGAYLGSIRRPIWYWYSTRFSVLKDYKGWSNMLTDGDSTGVTITRYDHVTDPNKKVYYAVMGTYNDDRTANYVLNIGANAVSATLVTMAYGHEYGVETPLIIAGGNITIPEVTEIPSYIKVEYSSDPEPQISKHKKRGAKWSIKYKTPL